MMSLLPAWRTRIKPGHGKKTAAITPRKAVSLALVLMFRFTARELMPQLLEADPFRDKGQEL
jgi:hypothetical protein